ncbi:MAG: hypothetical protein H6851_11235 [Geminicoccaceae bacterium]|nr:hypothetical protein [Geminicoccaceae bacterium]MCB9944176.1 hypothetical protein [Geminicoccaceae bacterium]
MIEDENVAFRQLFASGNRRVRIERSGRMQLDVDAQMLFDQREGAYAALVGGLVDGDVLAAQDAACPLLFDRPTPPATS